MDDVTFSDAVTCSPDRLSELYVQSDAHISILAQNIRSLNANFSGLLALMEIMKITCDIIVLTECWLSCNPVIPILEGYDAYKSARSFNQNDGVVLFIKNNLSNTKTVEPVVADCNCLVTTIGSDLAIIAIYRPYAFKDPSPFILSMDLLLYEYKSFKNIILVGDINIDIAKNQQNTHALDYLDLLAHHGLFMGHDFPTHGNTCLDHANLKTVTRPSIFVLESTVSDHYPLQKWLLLL